MAANKSKKYKRVKVPTIFQMEAVECGAASLSMILGYYGHHVPLEELRVECGVSRDGVKAGNLLKAAEKYGLIGDGYKCEPEELRELEFPLIIHWNFNHFLVLEGFGKDKAYLKDPAFGPRIVGVEEFDNSFTGIALSFSKGEKFEKRKDEKSLFAMIADRTVGNESALIFLILTGLMLVFPGILVPAFSKVFIDDILLGGMKDWLMPLIVGMVLTAAARGILTYIQQYFLVRFETKLSLVTSSKFVKHVLSLPMEFYMQRFSGDIVSRVQLNDRVAVMVSSELANSILSVITVLFFVVFMLFYSPVLTVIGVFFAGLNILFLKHMAGKRIDLYQRILQEKGKLQGISTSGLQTIETLKATGNESDFFEKWAGQHAKVMNSEQQMEISNKLLAAVPTLVRMLNEAVILSVGCYQVLNGHMTIGTLIAFQSLMASFMAPVNQLVSLGGKFQEAKGYLNRIDDVLDYKSDYAEGEENFSEEMESEEKEKSIKLEGYIELKDIEFGYSRLAPPLVNGFYLRMRPGQRIAIVGESGSGKSTIAKLVTGLYKPWNGEILFDGKAIKDHKRNILSNSIAMVDQDIAIFEGTIRENITLWDNSIKTEDIIKAIKDAEIYEDIMVMPGGLDSPLLEDGGNLSGGQKQRLEIARALVINPSIIIMDEATSALDSRTEKAIDNNIRRRGCGCLIIAHRLSTIRDSDEIIVMKEGRITQRGTNEELKSIKGAYADLIREY